MGLSVSSFDDDVVEDVDEVDDDATVMMLLM